MDIIKGEKEKESEIKKGERSKKCGKNKITSL